jgi:hypothetical protein
MGDTRPSSYAELLNVLDSIPVLVREKRRRDGLSIRAAGKASGVDFNAIARAEQGAGMQLGTARALLVWVSEPSAVRS